MRGMCTVLAQWTVHVAGYAGLEYPIMGAAARQAYQDVRQTQGKSVLWILRLQCDTAQAAVDHHRERE